MKPKTKWYNDKQMVGTLLIFFMPIGIYGVYKSETIETRWKNVTYATVVIGGLLLANTFLF